MGTVLLCVALSPGEMSHLLNFHFHPLQVAAAAAFHVLCRMVHLITYIENVDWWRSTAFTLGFLTNLVLFAFAFAPDL